MVRFQILNKKEKEQAQQQQILVCTASVSSGKRKMFKV